MKSTSSSRSLTNGPSSHTARTAASSSTSRMSPSGKKARRSSAEKLPAGLNDAYHQAGNGASQAMAPLSAMGSSHELLFQLQQLQHQQHFHQHGIAPAVTYGYAGAPAMQPMATAYAPYVAPSSLMQRMPSGMMPVDDLSMRQFPTPVVSGGAHTNKGGALGENGEDLMERIEKKDHMITQLGSFLSQIKQESEGTAHAWKEKMQEIAELKRQVAALSQQLRDSQEKERHTADQLAQVTEDVELAVHGLKESEAKHHEELKIMNEEIQRCQHEQERTHAGYEEAMRQASGSLMECQKRLDESTARCRSLEDATQKTEVGHRSVVEQHEDQRRELVQKIDQANEQLQSVDKEKEDLAQHLWIVTQALEQTTQREHSLQSSLEDASKEVEQNRATWIEKCQQMQTEKAELVGVQSMLQDKVRSFEASYLEERSQKEQINALMGEEMQRIGQEIQLLQQQHAAQLEQRVVEIDHWKNEASSLQEKLILVESQYVVSRKELDEWQRRASQIDHENQLLQKNGSEKAYTLQEINEQLRQALHDLHESRTRLDWLQKRCELFDAGVAQCLQLLPIRQCEGDDSETFPDPVVKALTEWKQQAGQLEQIKILSLRLQQDRDTEREKFRIREQELIQKSLNLHSDVDAAKADTTALAQEVQELTQRLDGNDAKLVAQVQQLTKDLEESRTTSALQLLQLQKTLESQKFRVQQLEGEKRELLQEAESMNGSMQTLYQAKNEKQVELDQMKTTWKELQSEHADVKESLEDLEANYEHTTSELNQKAKELQQLVQDLTATKLCLERDCDANQELLAKVQSELEAVKRQSTADQSNWCEKDRETQHLLEEKSQRLDEMMDMLTELRSRNEYLEQSRATDDQNARLEFDKFQQQLLTLSQEKKRVEAAYAHTKSQLDQLMPELFTLKEEKKHYSQAHVELDEHVGALRSELSRVQGDLERASRAKSALQIELNRATDEGQDVIRQFEVLRRDAKMHEKVYQEEVERMRKEIEDLRAEGSESAAMVEELQTKMTSVQNAANATINELMSELQNVQDTMGYDKTKFQKENEMLKAHVRNFEEDLRRKDADVKEIQSAFRQEKDYFSEKENELTVKVSRLTASLEAKKQEVDRLSKDLEVKGLKVAEYERKLNPLVNARDSLQSKCNEIKQALEAKTRDAHDLEERYRDELTRAVKEKRDVETMYMAMKEDYELIRSQSSGQQQQWQGEFRSMKLNLEKTKADLMKAHAEVLSLAQRLETCQVNAQDTIAELSTRLQGADQQKELAVNALQREVNLERERRREAEVQKMELQRLVRQKAATQSSTAGSITSMSPEDTGTWNPAWQSPSSQRHQAFTDSTQQMQARRVSAHDTASHTQAELPKQTQSATPPEYRKFYANEPMTNVELANLPMDLIKAQIGRDLSRDYTSAKSPSNGASKTLQRGAAKAQQADNNDDIPMLSLEKLPQNPEANDDDTSPTCDSSRSSRIVSEKRSGAVSLLGSLSSRSNSDRYLSDILEGSSRPQRNSSSSSLNSHGGTSASNNKKKPSTKKKRPSVMPPSSSAAAAAYSAFSTLSAPTPSPPKMKSNSKLLPRIQQ